jgi:prepilin-type processing-associated H-X9-DG protein
MVRVTNLGYGYELFIASSHLTRKIWLIDKRDRSEIVQAPSGTATLTIFLPASGTMATSYGMNSKATEIRDNPGKVLVMDYSHTVAFPDDNWSDYYPANGHAPVFARHNGRMNVLFTDGAVRLTEPKTIDPFNSTVESTYWLP